MATSSCPKCGSHTFECVEHVPATSRFKLIFVQCASCGAVVGVQDFFNIPNLLQELAGKLGFRLDL